MCDRPVLNWKCGELFNIVHHSWPLQKLGGMHTIHNGPLKIVISVAISKVVIDVLLSRGVPSTCCLDSGTEVVNFKAGVQLIPTGGDEGEAANTQK